ncbi:MAG: hypothetical protein J0I09_00520 [Sphingobacteriia bacterium]|nr:hypothetical protein [Sphingobacteriia bacterium]
MLLQKIFRAITSLPVLFFLNGAFLVSIFYFRIEDVFERNVFNTLSINILENHPAARTNQDSFFLAAMSLANRMQERRLPIFGKHKTEGLKMSLFHSAADDLLTGEGSCGSASAVLARILKANNYQVRLPQMKVNGNYGGHIVTEVKKNEGWIVLDALFKVYFKKPNGHLASFKEVSANWDYYKLQVPPDYPLVYSYADARYTNWGKVPVLGMFVKKSITLFKGKQYAEDFSLRSYLLRNYHFLVWVSLLFYCPVFILTVSRLLEKRRKVSLPAATGATATAAAATKTSETAAAPIASA